jgi:hypothetical protein
LAPPCLRSAGERNTHMQHAVSCMSLLLALIVVLFVFAHAFHIFRR